MLAKTIYEGVPIMVRFHPAVFRVLLRGSSGWEVPMAELEQFDPTEWRSCQQVLAMEDPSLLW